MLRSVSLLFLLFAISCHPTGEDCLTTFENELSKEQSELIAELTNSFGAYIENFDNDNFANNYRSFLTQLVESEEVYFNVPKDNDLGKRVLEIDSMIFKYDYYQNDDGEQRKFIHTYVNSDYILALKAVEDCSSLVAEYVVTIEETGGISPTLLASAVSQSFSNQDFYDPILQRILAVELYLPLLTFKLEERL